MSTWDPHQYLRYADERGRPFVELLARVGAEAPARVLDLGCGPGNLTELLAVRWPAADVVGVDSSPEMIAESAARAERSGTRVHYSVGDVRDWEPPPGGVDVVVSNATLQWVPGHLDLLDRLVGALAPGGWLACQVPGNFDEPTHTLRDELAAEEPYAAHTVGAARPHAHDAATYLEGLRRLGCAVDAWETTYLHVLRDPDSVFEWVSGTGARPVLAALPDELRDDFVDELKRRLRAAYPQRDGVVVLPFRRVFFVARSPDAAGPS